MNSYEIVEEHEGIIRILERTEDSPPTGYSKAYLEYQQMLDNMPEDDEGDDSYDNVE
jgi:hypothetical protein